MSTKPKLILSEQSRQKIVELADRVQAIPAFTNAAGAEAARRSVQSVRDLAQQRRDERSIDQAVRSTPVQV